MLERAREIENGITASEHKSMWEVHLDLYRKRFSDVLLLRSPVREIPGLAKKFLGDGGAVEFERLDGPDGPSLLAYSIPESVLFSIYRFAQYPRDYDDPVTGSFPESELELPIVRNQAFAVYIRRIREFKQRRLENRRVELDSLDDD